MNLLGQIKTVSGIIENNVDVWKTSQQCTVSTSD